jgi:predicted outer membrane repeat protein
MSARPWLGLEALEDRTAPAVLTVTTPADTPQAGLLTLREAITQANADARGGQSDTIVFDDSLGAATIALTGSPLTLSGVSSTASEAIAGAGHITVSGQDSSGVFAINRGVQADLSGLTITGGHASVGGGIDNSGGLTIDDCVVSGNTADSSGGGIRSGLGSTLLISNSTITGNSAPVTVPAAGGGIVSSSLATIRGSAIQGNSAYNGGGLNVQAGSVTITDSTIRDNDGPFGGGILSYGALTVLDSAITDNTATFDGGGIFISGTLSPTSLVLSNATLSGNTSGRNGGGLYATSATLDPVTLTNDTITNNRSNTASGSYQGGGLFVRPGTMVRPTLHDTLIAGNFNDPAGTSPDDVNGPVDPTSSYNLIGDGSGLDGIENGVNYNQIGSDASPIDPLLGPLGDYGGPTETTPPLGGSPALNMGDPTLAGTPDQRGVVRSGGVNIGAFQASAASFVVTAPDTATAGVAFDISVAVVDIFGQLAVGYTGTITFSTTDPDPGVVLPPDYTFQASDGGVVAFAAGVTLFTSGDQTLTVTDTGSGITGSTVVTL